MERDVDQVAERVQILHGLARVEVLDHATDAKVQAAEDDLLAVILDEGDYLASKINTLDVFDVVVYSGILGALVGIRQNFVHDSDVFKEHFSARVAMVLQVRHRQVPLHHFEHLRQEDYILSRILKLLLIERPDSVPEVLVKLHLL